VKLSQICIERPVLSTVISLVILLFGLVAMTRLQNREFPDVDPPIVSVSTVLPGAAPEVVETSVTQPLEDQIIGIAGIRHLTSLSTEQVSQITVEFELGTDVDLAANDVRDRVARARGRLPDDVKEPIVAKRASDASPIMWIALYGAGYTQLEISTIAETQMQDRLGKLPGVSDAIIAGEKRYAMRVWIDNGRLTAQQLTVADVEAALRRENVDIPSGRVEGTDAEFAVRTLGELKTPAEYGALVVARIDGAARPPPGRGARRGRARGRAEARPLQPQDRRRPRHHQAVEGQHARRRACRQGGARELRQTLPPGCRSTSGSTPRSSSSARSTTSARASSSRSSWW
jgi:multidrug efflux pump subunit AcrB